MNLHTLVTVLERRKPRSERTCSPVVTRNKQIVLKIRSEKTYCDEDAIWWRLKKHKEEKQLNLKKKHSFWRTHDLMMDILNLCVCLLVCLFVCVYVGIFVCSMTIYQLLDTCCGSQPAQDINLHTLVPCWKEETKIWKSSPVVTRNKQIVLEIRSEKTHCDEDVIWWRVD